MPPMAIALADARQLEVDVETHAVEVAEIERQAHPCRRRAGVGDGQFDLGVEEVAEIELAQRSTPRVSVMLTWKSLARKLHLHDVRVALLP